MTHFGFALDFSDIDLRNIDLLDTNLDLLGTDITSKIFFASKTSWRRPQDMSSRHVFKMSSRRLHHNNFSSSKTVSRRLCKTSWRRLGRRKIVTLKTCWRLLQDISWRRLQNVLKTKKCLLGRYKIYYKMCYKEMK